MPTPRKTRRLLVLVVLVGVGAVVLTVWPHGDHPPPSQRSIKGRSPEETLHAIFSAGANHNVEAVRVLCAERYWDKLRREKVDPEHEWSLVGSYFRDRPFRALPRTDGRVEFVSVDGPAQKSHFILEQAHGGWKLADDFVDDQLY